MKPHLTMRFPKSPNRGPDLYLQVTVDTSLPKPSKVVAGISTVIDGPLFFRVVRDIPLDEERQGAAPAVASAVRVLSEEISYLAEKLKQLPIHTVFEDVALS